MSSIILIGPFKAGKSVTAKTLAEKLGLPLRSTDQFRLAEFEQLGYKEEIGAAERVKDGMYGYYRYAIQFHAALVEKLLAEPGDAIFEVEAMYSVYEDENLLGKVKQLFEPLPNVVLLMPLPDLKESLAILQQRFTAELQVIYKINDFFVEHPSNYLLAKRTIYNVGKIPLESAEEIATQISQQEPSSLILIGPIMTGKSTLGNLVAEKLGRKHIRLDELRWEYYKEIGYDEALAARIRAEGEVFELYRYWQPFHAHAVERVLADYPNDCVIDFGGGHSVYEDASLLARAEQALVPFANVVLILPSPDKAESIQILRQRFQQEATRLYKLLEILTSHHSNSDLAKITIYTNDKSPEQISEEILSKINGNSPK